MSEDQPVPSPSQADSRAVLEAEIVQLRAENARLRGLLGLDDRPAQPPAAVWEPTLFPTPPAPAARVDRSSTAEAKIALYRSLFRGRDDVYALRWENERSGKHGWSPAVVGGAANARRPDREHLPLTDNVVEGHLAGRFHAGLYPLLPGDTCRLLVCDFDGAGWALDALAYGQVTAAFMGVSSEGAAPATSRPSTHHRALGRW